MRCVVKKGVSIIHGKAEEETTASEFGDVPTERRITGGEKKKGVNIG